MRTHLLRLGRSGWLLGRCVVGRPLDGPQTRASGRQEVDLTSHRSGFADEPGGPDWLVESRPGDLVVKRPVVSLFRFFVQYVGAEPCGRAERAGAGCAWTCGSCLLYLFPSSSCAYALRNARRFVDWKEWSLRGAPVGSVAGLSGVLCGCPWFRPACVAIPFVSRFLPPFLARGTSVFGDEPACSGWSMMLFACPVRS